MAATVVKRSYALEVSPTQNQVLARARFLAHDFIAERVGDLAGVSDIRLCWGEKKSVLYDVECRDEDPNLHLQVMNAVNTAISQLALTSIKQAS